MFSYSSVRLSEGFPWAETKQVNLSTPEIRALLYGRRRPAGNQPRWTNPSESDDEVTAVKTAERYIIEIQSDSGKWRAEPRYEWMGVDGRWHQASSAAREPGPVLIHVNKLSAFQQATKWARAEVEGRIEREKDPALRRPHRR